MDFYKCIKCGVTNSVYAEIRSTDSESPHTIEFIYECQDENKLDNTSLQKEALQMRRPTSHTSRCIIYCTSCGLPIIHRHFEKAPF